MARTPRKLSEEQARILAHGVQVGLSARAVRERLAEAGCTVALCTVLDWMRKQRGGETRPTAAPPRGGATPPAPPTLKPRPGESSREQSASQEPSRDAGPTVEVQSTEDVPALLQARIADLQAMLREQSGRGNVAATATLNRAINQTVELLGQFERPPAADPNAAPDVQAAAAEARDHLRNALSRAIARRERAA